MKKLLITLALGMFSFNTYAKKEDLYNVTCYMPNHTKSYKQVEMSYAHKDNNLYRIITKDGRKLFVPVSRCIVELID